MAVILMAVQRRDVAREDDDENYFDICRSVSKTSDDAATLLLINIYAEEERAAADGGR